MSGLGAEWPLLIGSLTRYSAEKSCCRRVIVDIRLGEQVAEKVGGTCLNLEEKRKKKDNCNLSADDIIAQVEKKREKMAPGRL